MPFSSFIPLTNHFVRKPLKDRVKIVTKILKLRTCAHCSLFLSAYAIPNINMNDDLLDVVNITL